MTAAKLREVVAQRLADNLGAGESWVDLGQAEAEVWREEADSIIPLVAREVLERAAKVAEGNCVCASFWAVYKRRDPNCPAHDIADSISSILAEYTPKVEPKP